MRYLFYAWNFQLPSYNQILNSICIPKVAIRLENPIWIFYCQYNWVYGRIFYGMDWRMHRSIWSRIILVREGIEQMYERKFDRNWRTGKSNRQSNRALATNHQIHSISMHCERVEYRVDPNTWLCCCYSFFCFSLNYFEYSILFRSIIQFSNFFEGIAATVFVWTLVSICGALLMTHIQLV